VRPLLHGTADTVIPAEQAREYERAVRALSKEVTTVYFEGAGHITNIVAESRAAARERAVAFLRVHLAK